MFVDYWAESELVPGKMKTDKRSDVALEWERVLDDKE